MTRHTAETLPANHPRRTVYTTERNGYTYRVARSDDGRGWRIDSFDGWFWVAFTTDVYPTKRAAVASFNAVAF
jgi:hypothetical protein